MRLCSSRSRSLDEDPGGTAARATAWLALEQPGPWGPRAATESLLDPALGAALDRAATEHGGRFALIKTPRSHPVPAEQHRVLVACTRSGARFLLTGDVEDPARALDVNWAAVVAGRVDEVLAGAPWLSLRERPVLLVCTNGRRDTCCALLGRPVAVALHDEHGDDVWEVTHVGGHRFAPTTVLLPQGWSHARVDPVTGSAVMAAAAQGRVVLDGLRGHGSLSPAEQVADIALRRELGDTRELAVRVLASRTAGDTTVVELASAGGTRTAVVRRRPGELVRPESCGKADVPLDRWDVTLALPPADRPDEGADS
jgi:hypothetical protein